VVTRGQIHRADQLPGLVAVANSEPVGLVTYIIRNGDCEIVTLDSLQAGKGIGSSLVAQVRAIAEDNHCARLWLITTNDNTDALCFYQKIGFELAAIHRGAIVESRKLKPQIPQTGNGGIPIRDEIELEIRTL
jgi:GNAT superfamily N-acetyltransferase